MASSDSPLPPDENLSIRNLAFIIVFLIVTTIVVLLRIVARICVAKRLGWDDWTILFALIGESIGASFVFVELHYGFGRHQQYLNQHQIQEYNKYVYGEWIQTFATLMWTKVSICLFLLRIPTSKALIRPLQAAMVFLILSHVILTLLWILQCLPVDAAWDKTRRGKCFSKGQKERIILAQAIISVVSDFLFAAYPILILWTVQMKVKTKAGLCCLMGLGVITGACCIVRTVLNSQSIPDDVTFGGITQWYWRTLEVKFGIIAACIPPLRPGYKWLCDTISSTFKRNTPSDHLPLTTKSPHMRNNAEMTSPSHDYSESTIGRPSLMATSSASSLPTTQIIKTTRIDIEKGPELKAMNNQSIPITGS